MKATFLYGHGDVRIETVPDPKIIYSTDAIVRATRSCVCGSDLHGYHAPKDSAKPDQWATSSLVWWKKSALK